MYLNLLLCAVFSGLAPKEKLDGLLKTVDEKLDPSLVALGNNSGYDDFNDCIRNPKGQTKGMLINQAVYRHPMTRKLAVEGIMNHLGKAGVLLQRKGNCLTCEANTHY